MQACHVVHDDNERRITDKRKKQSAKYNIIKYFHRKDNLNGCIIALNTRTKVRKEIGQSEARIRFEFLREREGIYMLDKRKGKLKERKKKTS